MQKFFLLFFQFAVQDHRPVYPLAHQHLKHALTALYNENFHLIAVCMAFLIHGIHQHTIKSCDGISKKTQHSCFD